MCIKGNPPAEVAERAGEMPKRDPEPGEGAVDRVKRAVMNRALSRMQWRPRGNMDMMLWLGVILGALL